MCCGHPAPPRCNARSPPPLGASNQRLCCVSNGSSANNIGFSRWDPEEQPPLVFEVDEPPGKLVRAPLPPPLPPAAACCRCRLLPLPLVFYPRQRPLPAYCSRCACSPSHGADHAPLCPQTLRVFHKSNFEVSVPPLFVTTHVLRAVHPLFALVV